MTKTDLPNPTSGEVVLYDPQLFPNLRERDPDQAMRRLAQRFERAESLEDLFNVLEGQASRDLVGRRLEIFEVEWEPYKSQRGVIPLAVCQAVDTETGEKLEFVTTSVMMTLFLRRAELAGLLPFVARIVATPTRDGQEALNFERA